MATDEVAAALPEIRLVGELDLAVAEEIKAKLDLFIGETVLVDLRRCEFIDSAGLAALLSTDARLRQQGGGLVLVGATKWVERVLEINGLTGTELVPGSRHSPS